jgi:hypothetical protein
MSELTTTDDALSAVRNAIATEIANVGATITSALADVDAQLGTLHARREELESALAAVNEQIAATDSQRAGLAAALAQITEDGQVAPLPTPASPAAPAAQTPAASPAPASAAAASPSPSPADIWDEAAGEEWIEFDEASLDPDRPRTERIVAVLEQAQQALPSADIAGVLNAYGDTTTTKVVSGTLANLVKRGLVEKVEHGMYAVPQ